MSFDIYVQWFRDGDVDGVPEDSVRRVLGDAIKTQNEHGWQVSYGPGLESDVYTSLSDSRILGLTVNRPSNAPALWQSLFDLLGLENAVFFFPGSGLFVRSSSVVAHLPVGMIEALGRPQVVSSAAALRGTLDPAS